MRVVIDTNVFVSSFFGGYPRKIIDLWKEGQFKLCLSRDIVDEYVAVLLRLGGKDRKVLDELLSLFASGWNSVYSAKPPTLDIIHSDPQDIECAVALNAQFIVSGDKHLLVVQDYMGIQILSPRQFLTECRK